MTQAKHGNKAAATNSDLYKLTHSLHFTCVFQQFFPSENHLNTLKDFIGVPVELSLQKTQTFDL